MGRGRSTVLACLMSLAFLAACSNGAQPVPSASAVVSPSSSAGPGQPSEEHVKEKQELYTFINTKLTGPFGVYTNLLDTDQSAEAATGHEVLSESASLMMLSAVRNGDAQLFARQWALGKQTFGMEGGFSYRYSPKQQKQYAVNAAVDDLRMIGALFAAGEVFGNQQYTEEAEQYSRRFYSSNVKDGNMYDLYDNLYQQNNGFITLCYINLSVLRKLSIDSESLDILLDNMSRILEQGYLSDSFPFYETRFDYKSGAYGSEHINTVESLLSILNLAEVGRQRPESIRFIKQQVEAGTLYGQYTREGKPANDIRSTAIYALAAMIGAEAGDDALYEAGIERMNEFRITDPASPLYGGFGDPNTGQAYSFDNLMALLAYSYQPKNEQ
ncbi:glycosyl hydrolase family 8 [Paenibacillus pedocola]|uniref:glycosyl hydrolase family 8 n=1 Tax=Paenibacillus pedocola TaxID=3242193 RepID=UPI0028779F2F|nr:glycosyl hydrolase family 8 [Paenibacillus typhae]